MSSSQQPASATPQPQDEFVYAGGELALFEHAVHWKAYFAKKLGRHITGKVLEVGAGIGGTTHCLCDGTQSSWVALEPDEQMATAVRARFDAEPPPIPVEVLTGTMADIAPDQRFDTILYIDVLEHIEHDATELEVAASHLEHGGCIVVLSPAHQWLYTPFDRAIGHFRRYDVRSLRAVAPPQLHETRMIYLDSVGMLASLGNRVLLSKAMPTPQQIRFWDSVLVRLSRWVDPLLAHSLGKTIVGIWQRP